MSWIESVSYQHATGRLRAIYDRIAPAGGAIDNILAVHAARPHTLEGHLALYKAVLHHSGNRLPAWVLETIGIHVSLLNRCAYCVDHHLAGLGRLIGDAAAGRIRRALETDRFEDEPAGAASRPGGPATEYNEPAIDARLRAMLDYATGLTTSPADVAESDIAALRAHGLDDGEILEVNQVVSYFAYANRTVLGLGVTTAGDTLGLSPGNTADPGDWRHS
jgi:AhpD family alkylhydroperoxidase